MDPTEKIENQPEHQDQNKDLVQERENKEFQPNDTNVVSGEVNNEIDDKEEKDVCDINTISPHDNSTTPTTTEEHVESTSVEVSPETNGNDKTHRIQWSPYMEVITETGAKELCPLKENEDLDFIHEADDHFETYEDASEIEEQQQPAVSIEEEGVTIYPDDMPDEIRHLLVEKDEKIMRLRMALQELEVLGTQAVDQLSVQIHSRDEQIRELEEKVAYLEEQNELLKQNKPIGDSETGYFKTRCQELEEKVHELTLANKRLEDSHKKWRRAEGVTMPSKVPVDALTDARPVPIESIGEKMTIPKLKDWVAKIRMEKKELPLNLEDFLLDNEFELAFGKRVDFQKEPKWKQSLIRKKIFKEKYQFDL